MVPMVLYSAPSCTGPASNHGSPLEAISQGRICSRISEYSKPSVVPISLSWLHSLPFSVWSVNRVLELKHLIWKCQYYDRVHSGHKEGDLLLAKVTWKFGLERCQFGRSLINTLLLLLVRLFNRWFRLPLNSDVWLACTEKPSSERIYVLDRSDFLSIDVMVAYLTALSIVSTDGILLTREDMTFISEAERIETCWSFPIPSSANIIRAIRKSKIDPAFKRWSGRAVLRSEFHSSCQSRSDFIELRAEYWSYSKDIWRMKAILDYVYRLRCDKPLFQNLFLWSWQILPSAQQDRNTEFLL